MTKLYLLSEARNECRAKSQKKNQSHELCQPKNAVGESSKIAMRLEDLDMRRAELPAAPCSLPEKFGCGSHVEYMR